MIQYGIQISNTIFLNSLTQIGSGGQLFMPEDRINNLSRLTSKSFDRTIPIEDSEYNKYHEKIIRLFDMFSQMGSNQKVQIEA